MECREALFLISPYLDGVLSKNEETALVEHVAGCEACAREMALQERISGALREISREEVQAPPGLCGTVMESLRAGRKKPAFGWLPASWRKAAAAAAAVLLIAGSSAGITAGLKMAGSEKTVGYNSPPAGVAGTAGGVSGPDSASGNIPGPQPLGGPGAAGSGQLAASTNAPGGAGELSSSENTGSTPAKDSGAPGTPNAAVIAPSETVTSSKGAPGGKIPAAGTASVGAGSPLPEEPRAFVSSGMKVTSTLLKVAAGDLEAARAKAVSLAAGAGAKVQVFPEQSGGKKIVVLRITAASDRAPELLAKLAGLGTVADRQDESRDIAALYNETMVQYLELQSRMAKARDDAERRQLETQAAAYKQQLDGWEAEAGKHVIMLWLEGS